MSAPDPRADDRRRWVAAGALALLSAALLLAVLAAAKGGRRLAPPPPRWRAVADAGEAWRAWRSAGVHGRVLLVFTGRWATVSQEHPLPSTWAADLAGCRPGPLPARLDADTALIAAASDGTARALDVVMPPAAYARRLAAVRGDKALRVEDGSFLDPFHGFPRRILLPGAPLASGEPVLVLVEPSFLGAGVAGTVDGWLRDRGLRSDLALVALDDPAATSAQRAAARALAERLGAAGGPGP